MNSKRTSSGFGINPLTWSDIDAYFNLIKVTPNTTEIQLIMALDNIVLEHHAEQQKKEQARNSKKKP